VAQYLNGGNWQLAAEVVEVESGKRNDRPKLAEALRLCRIHGATLIIAKLDRLARNVAFTSNLMESGVDFVAVDFPQANRLTIHILAAVAEHEAQMISERTKAALARSTKKLGGFRPNGKAPTREHALMSAQVRQAKAAARAKDLAPILTELWKGGAESYGSIAKQLTDRGIPTARGKSEWSPMQVKRLVDRLAS
jgi:DNA invertase Pin-like site-specific DNA recombinase